MLLCACCFVRCCIAVPDIPTSSDLFSDAHGMLLLLAQGGFVQVHAHFHRAGWVGRWVGGWWLCSNGSSPVLVQAAAVGVGVLADQRLACPGILTSLHHLAAAI
jgi:hypothetical protein